MTLLTLERKQKKFFKLISNSHIFLFLSYSFEMETINFSYNIHSRSSLKNHTRFQTKMGEVYTRFQSKTAQKPYPMGRNMPIWLI